MTRFIVCNIEWDTEDSGEAIVDLPSEFEIVTLRDFSVTDGVVDSAGIDCVLDILSNRVGYCIINATVTYNPQAVENQ